MRPQDRTLLRAAALIVIGGPAAFAALVTGLYVFGLSQVPERPSLAAHALHAPLLEAAFWARFGGVGTPELEPMTPWSFARLRACRAMAARFEVTGGREACLRAHTGVAIAAAVAQEHVRDQGTLSGVRREAGQVSTAAWLTRNGDFTSVTDYLAATANWGHGWRGADEAAQGFFGKALAALGPDEVALLAASVADPTNRSPAADPWQSPDAALAARNVVLERMAGNGALAAGALAEMSRRPLGVRPAPAP